MTEKAVRKSTLDGALQLVVPVKLRPKILKIGHYYVIADNQRQNNVRYSVQGLLLAPNGKLCLRDRSKM